MIYHYRDYHFGNDIVPTEKVAIFVHISADGDALGSAFALKYNLNKMNKVADVYLNEDVSERLEFMQDFASSDYKTQLQDCDYDCLVALDCGDSNRLGIFKGEVKKETTGGKKDPLDDFMKKAFKSHTINPAKIFLCFIVSYFYLFFN